MTRKMSKVRPVHVSFCWKLILDSGEETSGRIGRKGFTRSKKRTALMFSFARLRALELETHGRSFWQKSRRYVGKGPRIEKKKMDEKKGCVA